MALGDSATAGKDNLAVAIFARSVFVVCYPAGFAMMGSHGTDVIADTNEYRVGHLLLSTGEGMPVLKCLCLAWETPIQIALKV
jgi:hypothetical protein